MNAWNLCAQCRTSAKRSPVVNASVCHGPSARPWLAVERQGHDASRGLRHPCCVTPRPTLLDTSSRPGPSRPNRLTSTVRLLHSPSPSPTMTALPKGYVKGARYCASTWARPRVSPRSSGWCSEGSTPPAATACGHPRSPPVVRGVSRRTTLPS